MIRSVFGASLPIHRSASKCSLASIRLSKYVAPPTAVHALKYHSRNSTRAHPNSDADANDIQYDVNDSVAHISPVHTRQTSHTTNRKRVHMYAGTQNIRSKLISTEWVKVTKIPHLSTLDDLLPDLQRIMTTEVSMGIVDLDAAERMLENETFHDDAFDQTPKLPFWKPNPSLAPHLVVEARLMLSTLKRQHGWYLKFPNRSVVHALMSHLNEARKIEYEYKRNMMKAKRLNQYKLKPTGNNPPDEGLEMGDIPELCWSEMPSRPLMCAWQRVQVSPFYVDGGISDGDTSFTDGIKYMIGDNVLRVENCPRESSIDDMKYFFRRYELHDERKNTIHDLKAVEQIVEGMKEVPYRVKGITPSKTSSFLVRFASSADARAALREKQNVEFLGRRVKLARYSRQILGTDVL